MAALLRFMPAAPHKVQRYIANCQGDGIE